MDDPSPFLAIPLAKNLKLEISQGWVYSEDERSIHPSIPTHFAVDFPAAWGTPVYAPADGLALSSYHTYDMVDSQGRTIGYGLGLFIAIWHDKQQLYTSYSHLSGINDKSVPYVQPSLENGNWQPRRALYVSVETFKTMAKPVKRGDLIGFIGYSGLRLGYTEVPSNPPKIDPLVNKTWDPHGAHLHWEVYTRTLDGSKKDRRMDPFGIEGLREKYAKVFAKARGLILANPDGSPQWAK
ncbi:MAG: M23 family metallopeptidase [bacterium]|nr:M23 family metallopeptidase [bacterium]